MRKFIKSTMRRRNTNRKRFIEKLKNLTPVESDKLEKVTLLTHRLFEEYHLEAFKFTFGYGKYRGKCNNHSIFLNLNYALTGEMEQIRNTLLHEIAHALVGPGHGHKDVWQNKARELGVTWGRNYRK